jgi:hypothetical protein
VAARPAAAHRRAGDLLGYALADEMASWRGRPPRWVGLVDRISGLAEKG